MAKKIISEKRKEEMVKFSKKAKKNKIKKKGDLKAREFFYFYSRNATQGFYIPLKDESGDLVPELIKGEKLFSRTTGKQLYKDVHKNFKTIRRSLRFGNLSVYELDVESPTYEEELDALITLSKDSKTDVMSEAQHEQSENPKAFSERETADHLRRQVDDQSSIIENLKNKTKSLEGKLQASNLYKNKG